MKTKPPKIHFRDGLSQATACSQPGRHASTNPINVTCGNCRAIITRRVKKYGTAHV